MRRSLLVVLALAAGCGSQAVPSRDTPAAPIVALAAPTGWRYVAPPARLPHTETGRLTAVAATGPRDAWSIGTARYPGKGAELATTGYVGHWNGHRWRRSIVAEPRNSEMCDISALSSKNVWVAGGTGRTPWVRHFDGKAWRTYRFPNRTDVMERMRSVTALSPTDVWAADLQEQVGRTRLLTHWDGRQWHQAGGVLADDEHVWLSKMAGARSGDLWAVGSWLTRPHDPGSATPMIAHWDGRTWSIVWRPGTPGRLTAVKVVAPNDVWALGSTQVASSTPGGDEVPLLRHWDGFTWTTVPAPRTGGAFIDAAPDGHGGLWTTQRDDGRLLHYDGHDWSRVRPGKEDEVYSIARVPGSGALWAVGAVGGNVPQPMILTHR